VTPYYSADDVTIYHADCREILPMGVQAVITDPPYGLRFEYGGKYDDSRSAWFQLMNESIHLIRQSAAFVILPCGGIDRLRWWFINHDPEWIIAWYKGSPGHRSAIGFNDWEPHLVWGDPPKAMHDYFQTRCGFEIDGHPCPKPIEWAAWLISRSTKIGQTVLDPFMGSGTTLRAAKDLGRKAIGIEIEERYCEIAARRMAQEVLNFAS
jgi:site-specific DNA-methyltransferase (adenine-specific)